MAALALLEDIANRRIRREREFRDQTDLLAHDDDWLMSRFRLPKAILLELCTELGPALQRETVRNHGLPVPLQVRTTLGFLKTGAFQRELADQSGISQPSLSRAMPAVWNGIIRMSPRYIRFPFTVGEKRAKQAFWAKYGFPGVLGAIDCTHVQLRPPSENTLIYINRKGTHSINIQVICDATCKITHVFVNYPGSNRDSFILANSAIPAIFEGNPPLDGWLLGDNSYPLKTWLMTPFIMPATENAI
uniref:Putative nuclease HARBI1 n=1 Tax=Sander lucioperca TaxID=283035 RepID=A0A8C9ZM49_SANLU